MTKDQKDMITGTIILFLIFNTMLYLTIGFVLMVWDVGEWPLLALILFRFLFLLGIGAGVYSIYYNNYRKVK